MTDDVLRALDAPIRAAFEATNRGVRVSGNGYNGGGAFVIASNGEHITRWDISG